MWGQSSNALCTKIEALPAYETMQQCSAGFDLLNAIKDLMYNVQNLKYVPLAIYLAKQQFYSSLQPHIWALPVIWNSLKTVWMTENTLVCTLTVPCISEE